MKILWLCNYILPEFSEEFGLRKNPFGGWVTGLLQKMKENKEIEIGFCFPVIDEWRLKDGIFNSQKYYSFNYDFIVRNYDSRMVKRFEIILNDFNPDVIHIWGTELPSSSAMFEACENISFQNKVIVDIQGIMYYYSAYHFYANLPEKYITLRSGSYLTIEEDRNAWIERKIENELIKKVRNVFGRTEWDRVCVEQINSEVNYYFCNRNLRPSFYEHIGKWDNLNCEKYSIFVSQAHAPLKGLHYVLQAMPAVLAKYPDAHIYVSGTTATAEIEKALPPYAIYISDLINELNLGDKITFLGRLDEEQMVQKYLKSHVFVSAASIENQCNSVTEAKLLGVPVVCSYVGGMYERINHGVDGFLYQHDAPYMMAHYICKIFADDELAKKLSINASESMIVDTDREINSNKIIEVYKKIALGEV